MVAGGVDPEQAQFFMALGALGNPRLAAEQAGVSWARACRWTEGLARPEWLSNREMAARQLFYVAVDALVAVRQMLPTLEETLPAAAGPTSREAEGLFPESDGAGLFSEPAGAEVFVAPEGEASGRVAGRARAVGRAVIGLRDLVMVAERFFSAAVKLDKDVGRHDDTGTTLDLGPWGTAAADARAARTPSGAGGGDA